MNKHKLKCLFGFHNYTIPVQHQIFLCQHCKRHGRRVDNDGWTAWFDFDEKQRKCHVKTSSGYEEWYDEKGHITRNSSWPAC